jgi:hypothetical protein
MSLSTNVSNLATRIATEVKAIRTLVNGNAADLSSLTTSAKSNLVLAINELKTSLDAAASDISALETADINLASDISDVDGKVGTLGSLTTTDKTNLVAAINELQTEIETIDLSALINDTTTAGTTTWSSSKISSEIGTAVSALVDGAPALLDTLNELAAAIGDDSNYAATMTTALGTKQDKVTGVSDTEIGYLDGVTSSIQTQINSKLSSTTASSTYAPKVSPTFSGTVVLPSATSIGNVSATEIGYIDGVTSSIQTQLNSKLSSSFESGTILINPFTTGGMTPSGGGELWGVPVSGLPGPLAIGDKFYFVTDYMLSDDTLFSDVQIVVTSLQTGAGQVVLGIATVLPSRAADLLDFIQYGGWSSIDSTDYIRKATYATISNQELGYLDGVTSGIQAQLDAKASTSYVDSEIAAIDLSGKQDVVAGVTSTEIGYLDGVTSAIQDQLNAKASSANVGDTTVNYVTTFEAGLV